MNRVVLCSGVLVLVLVVAAAVARQTPPPSSTEGSIPPRAPSNEPRSSIPVSPTPPPAKAPSIDDLLNKLDSLKAQKAAIEKAEKETVELLKEKLKQQKHRLQKLGVNVEEGNRIQPAPPPPAPASPPPVGSPVTSSN
jgi:hypothetical protein